MSLLTTFALSLLIANSALAAAPLLPDADGLALNNTPDLVVGGCVKSPPTPADFNSCTGKLSSAAAALGSTVTILQQSSCQVVEHAGCQYVDKLDGSVYAGVLLQGHIKFLK
jgi:hypothetical protein